MFSRGFCLQFVLKRILLNWEGIPSFRIFSETSYVAHIVLQNLTTIVRHFYIFILFLKFHFLNPFFFIANKRGKSTSSTFSNMKFHTQLTVMIFFRIKVMDANKKKDINFTKIQFSYQRDLENIHLFISKLVFPLFLIAI